MHITAAVIVFTLLGGIAAPVGSNFQSQANPSVFTDGHGGNVFTAKDIQMESTHPDYNGGLHRNIQFEVYQRALMGFDLSSIPSYATVLDATLYLYHSYEPEGGKTATITIYPIAAANGAWIAGMRNLDPAFAGEACWGALASDGHGGVQTSWAGSPGLSTSGVDYETAPLASFTFNPNSAKGAEFAIPLNRNRVQGWLGATNTNYGMVFFSSANTGHVAQSSHSTTHFRPKLVVHYTLATPAPTSTSVTATATLTLPISTLVPTASNTPTSTRTITPTPTGATVIVDNINITFSTVGNWTTGRSSSAYGSTYAYTSPGTGSAQAIYRPNLPSAGAYEVFIWAGTAPNGPTNQPYTIYYSGGYTVLRVNLRGPLSGGYWIRLGTFNFSAGTNGYVVLSNDADSYVGADAIRWVKIP